MITVIPAYQPADTLVDLVTRLRVADAGTVLVVDDGSGPAYRELFARAGAAGATVIGYPGNRGKGHALKAGFAEAMRRQPGEDVVCADADGQHTVADILAVAARLASRDVIAAGTPVIVLGERSLQGGVPLRSRIGNSATRLLFRLVTGLKVHDTQTGLRGYPAALLPELVRVPGTRYEYELNVLLAAHAAGWRLMSVPISTVYLEGNASSHFRPLADSARIYAPLLKFCASSLAAFAVDAAGVLYLYALTGSLLVSVVGARAVSATVNYLVNRQLVFREGRDRPARSSALRYAVLLVAMLAANWAVLSALTGLGLALLPAKIVTDLSLFVVNYSLQHRVVFAGRPAGREPEPEPSAVEGAAAHS